MARPSDVLRPPFGRRITVAAAAAAAAAAILLAACGSPSAGPDAERHGSTTRPADATTPTAAPDSRITGSTSSTSAHGSPPWAVLSQDAAGVAVEERTITVPSGHVVTLVRFDAGRVVFDLHVGSTDPPVNLAIVPGDRGPAIAADEAPFLLAAFNGGFKLKDGPGGFEVEGVVVAPLVDGRASFVIDVNGTAHIGVWGRGLPAPGEHVASVRQNLLPLITAGVPSPTVGLPSDWGATLTTSKVVPRSAAGEDARGDIIYAAGMAVLPADLSAALLGAGAVDAMQLDINPEWVQLDAAGSAGARLVAQIPGQNRPSAQYVAGWTRDFFAVLAPVVASRQRPR